MDLANVVFMLNMLWPHAIVVIEPQVDAYVVELTQANRVHSVRITEDTIEYVETQITEACAPDTERDISL